MTTSRKIVIVLCAAFFGYGGFLTLEQRSATSQLENVRDALAVGDPTEKIERVMKEKGFEPNYSHEKHFYFARISLHHKRDVIMLIYVDGSGKVARIEIKTHMWI